MFQLQTSPYCRPAALRGSPGCPHRWLTAYKFGGSRDSPNLLWWLTELRKRKNFPTIRLGFHPSLWITCDHFTIKTTTQEQPNEETQRVRPGEVLNTEFLCVAPMESECVTLLAHPWVQQTWSSIKPWCREFLLRFHYIGQLIESLTT